MSKQQTLSEQDVCGKFQRSQIKWVQRGAKHTCKKLFILGQFGETPEKKKIYNKDRQITVIYFKTN